MTTDSIKDFYETLPGKRMASGALYFNPAGDLLIVKPGYRADWLVPGGIVEKGKSPYDCCVREVCEETGLILPVGRLLCIEYRSASGPKTDSLQLIFYGGVMTDEQVSSLHPQEDEIDEIRFCPLEQALPLLPAPLAARVQTALQALKENRVIYMENNEIF